MARDSDYIAVVAGLRAQLDAATTLLKLKPDRKIAKIIIGHLDDSRKEIYMLAGDNADVKIKVARIIIDYNLRKHDNMRDGTVVQIMDDFGGIDDD